ncbi:hypothetical protein BHM03_00005164 [Ensete ventricosum]|nr:hypothetical protein BHM03_00005164 [Ensete ventricosum]
MPILDLKWQKPPGLSLSSQLDRDVPTLPYQVKMMQARNIKPYDNTFAVLSVGCSRTLELDMAESFSDKISDKLPKNIHTFNTLLAACGFMVPIIGPSI